ncbi:MAG TPA: sialidase family protein, partial [Ktedonobacteraceae bacterium]|nr:sialidase family protein [Ktedonobacteraceae bacterium]
MNMEPEVNEGISRPTKRVRARRVLLSMVILLALIGATVFFLVHQFSQNTPGPANTTHVTIHWQRIAYHNASYTLFAAPGNPATLYMCGYPSSSATDTTDSSSESSFVLMRSTDAGIHWHIVTTTFPGDSPCIIAINPANTNDLYTVSISFSSSSNFQDLKASSLLSHSSDGGKTWTKVATTLLLPSGQHITWAGGGLAFIGHRLFARQELHGAYHLISSSDGGQSWTFVDAQLFEPHQELHSYTVDPSMPNTIYELVGPITGGWFSYVPIGTPVPTPTPTPLSADKLFANLYKTVDGGATWQKLPISVPYGTSIQLVRSNPRLLYVGGRVLI